jgi:hypothetical protein
MECMLRWWDNLDDAVNASRQLLVDALTEFGSAVLHPFRGE